MPAVPALIMAGGAIGSHFIGNKMADSAAAKASQRSPEELALMKSQTGLADSQRAQGDTMFGAAMPAIRNTMGYYGTLLSGSRGARTAAVAPEAQDIASVYDSARGSRGYARGGERATADAENERAKAGAISRLVSGVRPGAASALGGTASGLVNAGGQRYGQAGQIYGQQGNNFTQNRQFGYLQGQQEGNDFSKQFGGMIADFAKLYSGKGGKSKQPMGFAVPGEDM